MSEDPRKPRWDDFKPVGETRAVPRRPLAGYVWLVIGLTVAGALAGYCGTLGYDFWRGTPPRSGARHAAQRRAYERFMADRPTPEERAAYTRRAALFGAVGGLVLGAGFCVKDLPRGGA
ncbi:MAG TPA: hypothetical protein PLS90_07405 [Candidatus Sumerlaeota bacterium]|nr:hypothetical protein [Candidatus Sumerlaeota bacterium]HOR27526.1 hypothetical protein [Candidatus Sumerlaeota bacterium]HPK02271.1 hypothetical protein [Candidatus Sumerlaeota bacterium]